MTEQMPEEDDGSPDAEAPYALPYYAEGAPLDPFTAAVLADLRRQCAAQDEVTQFLTGRGTRDLLCEMPLRSTILPVALGCAPLDNDLPDLEHWACQRRLWLRLAVRIVETIKMGDEVHAPPPTLPAAEPVAVVG